MSLATATVLYNVIMLGLLGLVLFWFRRCPGWSQFLSSLLLLIVLSLLVSMVLCLPDGRNLRAARFLCFGWFGHVSVFLVGSCLFSKQRDIRCLAIALLVTIASLVTYCFGVEPFRLEITHYEVQSSKVEDQITIAVLADFQTDKFKEYQRASLLRLMQEKPDVIVLAGDYLQSRTQQGWQQLRDQMRAYLCEIDFAAPQGVYAVGGNTDFRRWPEIFLGRNVEIFTASRTIKSEAFVITGLAVEDSFATDLTIPEESSKLHIVLGHAPDFSLSAGINADLLIAGHTHGGQVRLPWIGPLVTFSQVPRAWAAGLTQFAPERTLVVSRGVGMERRDAPRLRFLCRPQLVFIHIVPNERSLGTKRCLRKVSI